MEQGYTIKQVTQLTGLNEHTLRAWERRYGVVEPSRSASGRRLYAAADVERLRLVAALAERGHAVSLLAQAPNAALARLAAEGQALAKAPDAAEAGDRSGAPARIQPAAAFVRKINGHLARYQLAEVFRQLDTARITVGARAFLVDVVSPLMAETGVLVGDGRLTIAQEHALSAVVKAHLLDLLFALRRNSPAGGQAMSLALATREGDLHEIGLLIGGALAALHGWTVYYLGPNLPADALADAMAAMKARIALIGLTALPPGTVAWTVAAYAKRVYEKAPRGTEVWLGGDAGEAPLPAKLPARALKTFAELEAALAHARKQAPEAR